MTQERIEKLEAEVVDLKLIANSLQKDTHSNNKLLADIADSLKELKHIHQALIQQDNHFMLQMQNIKHEIHDVRKEAQSAVDMVKTCGNELSNRITSHDQIFRRLAWIVITAVIGAVMGLVLVQ